MAPVTVTTLVRAELEEVARVATDPNAVFPTIGGLGRFEHIESHPDNSQVWDLYLDVGTIHVGGRVLVEPPSDNSLVWHSLRGTAHNARIVVSPATDGATLAMTISANFTGRLLTGWITSVLADRILARRIEASLQQLRHRIEYGD